MDDRLTFEFSSASYKNKSLTQFFVIDSQRARTRRMSISSTVIIAGNAGNGVNIRALHLQVYSGECLTRKVMKLNLHLEYKIIYGAMAAL